MQPFFRVVAFALALGMGCAGAPVVDGIAGLVAAFDKAPVVAFGETHANQAQHAFLESLLRNRAFTARPTDVVVEFGSASGQATIDRYVAGEPVPQAEIHALLRNTTQLLVWNAPVYEHFFQVVRAVNRTLPARLRVRVLLGDPPVDWSRIHTPKDYFAVLSQRDTHFAEVIEKEVLSRGRRALLVAGVMHVLRRPTQTGHVVPLLEQRHPGSTFVILAHVGFGEEASLEARLASWPKPSLVFLKGTWLGALRARSVYNYIQTDLSLEQAADAYLYLGPARELAWAKIPRVYPETDYMAELDRRHRIVFGMPYSPDESPLFGRQPTRFPITK